MMLSLLLLASVVPSGQSFACTPVAVWDGDGPIWCAEGPHVRLSGVAAREMNSSCSPGHPCPDADPVAARDHLVGLLGEPQGRNRTGHILVRGPGMRCLSRGGAGGTRTAAFCSSPRAGDISCAMVRSGLTARWDKYWGAHRCD
jgi:endonuclease YncB( thermonuclease family)